MQSSSLAKFLPKIQDALFIMIFVAVLLLGNRMLNLDGDLPRHLVTGKFILQTGQLPATEPFTYPYQNKPFVSQQWLAGVIFYLIYLAGGLSGIVIISAILLAGTFSFLHHALVKKLNLRLPILFLVAWGAIITSLSWITRPHLFSMFFLAIWLDWSDKLRRGENISIWRFPVFMLIWTNIHGEFISGILTLLAYAVGAIIDHIFGNPQAGREYIKRLWLTLLLCILTSVLNPGGLERWRGMIGFMNNQYMMSRMLETNPPNFQTAEMRVLLAFMAMSIFLLAFNKSRLSAGQGILLAGFSAMGLMAFRNIHLYGVVAPFVLGEVLVDLRDIKIIDRIEKNLEAVESGLRGFVWQITTVIVLTVLIYTSNIGARLYIFNPESFPTQAMDWLKSHPQQGYMFNDLNWGGYISFNLWPGQLTFTDSVADLTGELTMQYETAVTLLPGWEGIFEEYDIQWAVIPAQSPLAEALVKEKKWRVLYEDNTAVILRK